MTNYARQVSLATICLIITACGSVPEQQHEGIEAVNEAMSHGMRAYRDDRYLEARQLFRKGLAHYRSMDNPEGALIAYINLIDVALITGEFAEAQRWLDDASRLVAVESNAALRRRLDFQSVHLAWLTLAPGEEISDAVISTLDQFATPDSDFPELMLGALFLRTRIALDTGDDNANARLQRLREAVAADPDALNLGRLARLEAELAGQEGDLSAAKTLLRTAQEHYRKEKYRPGLAAVHEELADLEARQDNLETAVFHAEQALFIRLWITDRHHTGLLLRQLSDFETTLGHANRADEYLALADFVAADSEIKWNTLRQRLRSGRIN